MTTEPTDADMDALWSDCDMGPEQEMHRHFARAVLARWGQPSGAGEPVAYLHKHKHIGMVEVSLRRMTDNDFNRARWECIPLYTAPQPTQAVPPAGREPTEDEIAAWIMKSVRDGKYPITGRTVPFRGELLPMFIAFANDHGIGIKGKEAGNADG